jgi:hypothetical protein
MFGLAKTKTTMMPTVNNRVRILSTHPRVIGFGLAKTAMTATINGTCMQAQHQSTICGRLDKVVWEGIRVVNVKVE